MRKLLLSLLVLFSPGARADVAGEFDYYVLSLSWSPNWCAVEGDARGSEQCKDGKDHGWILHGLWPQFERGYPAYCQTAKAPPSRRMTAQMADIMGTSGLAWHQWKKHGTCTNLTASEYYETSRDAYERIVRPDILRRLTQTITVSPTVIEAAFLDANPLLKSNQITITCKADHIQEARICLTRDLSLRTCGADVLRDCTQDNAIFTPLR